MGTALYRQYRPRSLDDVVGQKHITTTIKNALKLGKIRHAYLFTGPRGVGKTTVARILAHLLNDVDYKHDSSHLDILEIDAASNRRIDEIRELRDKVHIVPSSGKYKVYIIDEVHMLTREAFNALLKTLEEPPEHAIFILATTEAHKLPETIVSRTQRFTFRQVGANDIASHLKKIAKQESIEISDEALQILAEHSDGALRDGISLLDQASGLSNKIDATEVQDMLGLPPERFSKELLEIVSKGDRKQVIARLAEAKNNGYSMANIGKSLVKLIKYKLIDSNDDSESQTLKHMLKELIELPGSHDPDTLLEIILLTSGPASSDKSVTTNSEAKPRQSTTDSKASEPSEAKPESNAPATKPTVNAKQETIDEQIWQQSLLALKQTHSTLHTIARMASPTIQGDTLILGFKFPFHLKRISDSKNLNVISDIVNNVSTRPLTIVCELNKSEINTPKTKDATQEPTKHTVPDNYLQNISNIFGGGEVLE